MTNYNPNSQSQNIGGPNITVLSSWAPYTLHHAYMPKQKISYITGNLFELPSLNIVYGAPGSLKSFLLADLACCVAGGTNWLPSMPNSNNVQALPTNQSPVLWLDFDNGVRRTNERFAVLGKALNLPTIAPLNYFSMPTPLLNVGDATHVKDLTEIICHYLAKLVVIDNLGSISGGADENSGEMIKIFANMRQIAETTGAAIVIIHHPRKSNSNNGRKGDTLRGHSSIEAALDLALLIERLPNSLTISIQPTKVRGSDIKPFGARFTYQNDLNGDIETARFFAETSQSFITTQTIREAIIDCLSSKTLKKSDLVAQVMAFFPNSVGRNKTVAEIDALIVDGYIKQNAGKNNSKLLSCNPAKPF